MRYKNVVTGAILDSPCEISGGNWQALPPAGIPLKKKEPVKKEEPVEIEPEETVSEPEPGEKEEAPAKKADKKSAPNEKNRGAIIKARKGK